MTPIIVRRIIDVSAHSANVWTDIRRDGTVPPTPQTLVLLAALPPVRHAYSLYQDIVKLS